VQLSRGLNDVLSALGTKGEEDSYEIFSGRHYSDSIHRAMIEMVAERKAPRRILDLHCGTGRLLHQISAKWTSAKLIGVDSLEESIRIAKNHFVAAELYVSPIDKIPLVDESADIVFSALAFQDIPDGVGGVLREVSRVLKRDGVFCLSEFTLPLIIARVLKKKSQKRNDLVKALTANGFSVRGEKQIYMGIVSIISASRT